MLHLDFCTIGVCCWLPWQSPAVFFPAPSQAIAEQHYTGENQDRFCLWSRIPWPFEVILCVQCCWLLMSWDKKDFIKGKQESKVVAGLRWALQQRDDFGLFLRRAELLVLGWQWLCHSWDHGYCWALVTPGAVSGTWTLWYWIFSLKPPRAMWHGLIWFTAQSSAQFGLRRAVVFPSLWGHCLWGHYRAGVLTGGDELAPLEVFDHPHWVKLGVYSEVCPLLTPECLRTATTSFKSMVENLTRGYTKMGLSL